MFLLFRGAQTIMASETAPLCVGLSAIEHNGEAIARSLAGPGFFLVRLDAAVSAELVHLRFLATSFFALAESAKHKVGERSAHSGGVGGEGIGYRAQPEHESEFLETFLHTANGLVHPPIAAPAGLDAAAGCVHRSLSRLGRRILAVLATHLRLPQEALIDHPLALFDDDTGEAGDTDQAGAAGEPDAAATSSSLLRICHYDSPSAETVVASDSDPDGVDVLFPEHADSTLLTLSPIFADTPGLQLKQSNGTFLDVERLPSAQPEPQLGNAQPFYCVEVHAGDYLGILSRGLVGALRHRVVRRRATGGAGGSGGRVSCPLLLRPRDAWRRNRGWLQALEDADADESSSEEEPAARDAA